MVSYRSNSAQLEPAAQHAPDATQNRHGGVERHPRLRDAIVSRGLCSAARHGAIIPAKSGA